MEITTKTGDRGKTGLLGGRRVSKASPFIELLGELDELQSFVGWAKAACGQAVLSRVQDDLYRMMAVVGAEMKCPEGVRAISEKDIEFLEKEIAALGCANLSEFVRPGSSEKSARLHIVRTVCRRVERRMVGVEMPEFMLKYLNRLSDLLFVLAYKLEKLLEYKS